MSNVIHFEIGADDLEAAASFYSNVFDWKIEKSEDGSEYWYITVPNEEDPEEPIEIGGLSVRFDELNATVNTINVPSLDSCARKITEGGGKVLTPKKSIPGMGYFQDCKDREGNVFRILEYDDLAQ